jgi:hypothetical protein
MRKYLFHSKKRQYTQNISQIIKKIKKSINLRCQSLLRDTLALPFFSSQPSKAAGFESIIVFFAEAAAAE